MAIAVCLWKTGGELMEFITFLVYILKRTAAAQQVRMLPA
jgi:hypothetical protein